MSKIVDVYHHGGAGYGVGVGIIGWMLETGHWAALVGMLLGPVASIAYIWFKLNADFFSKLFLTAFAPLPAYFLGGFIGTVAYLVFHKDKKKAMEKEFKELSKIQDHAVRQQKMEDMEKKYGKAWGELVARLICSCHCHAANPYNPQYQMLPKQHTDLSVIIDWIEAGKPTSDIPFWKMP
jgi:hypothetical protein